MHQHPENATQQTHNQAATAKGKSSTAELEHWPDNKLLFQKQLQTEQCFVFPNPALGTGQGPGMPSHACTEGTHPAQGCALSCLPALHSPRAGGASPAIDNTHTRVQGMSVALKRQCGASTHTELQGTGCLSTPELPQALPSFPKAPPLQQEPKDGLAAAGC